MTPGFKATLPPMRDRSDTLGGLAVQGYGSRPKASEAQQQPIESEKGLLGAVDKQHQASAAMGAALQRRLQTEREAEGAWRRERAEAIEKRAATEQEILKARKRRDLQSLVSPIDGTVTNLAAWTVGGVVKPGDTLPNVVPLPATPEIEAMVSNKDIGFVATGQKLCVKFDAFPFTRHGTVDGEVIDPSAGSGQAGKRVAIAPGMAVAAESVTGDRRVIDYILSPILRHRHESGRER